MIVTDNTAFHKRLDIIQSMEREGHIVLGLAPYGPDLNPIEKTWAWIKALRKSRRIDGVDMLFFRFFTIVSLLGWFYYILKRGGKVYGLYDGRRQHPKGKLISCYQKDVCLIALFMPTVGAVMTYWIERFLLPQNQPQRAFCATVEPHQQHGDFWNQAKRLLRKYSGVKRKSFPLFLKEYEFRFSFSTSKRQLKILRLWYGI